MGWGGGGGGPPTPHPPHIDLSCMEDATQSRTYPDKNSLRGACERSGYN
jgi:hypothetical protein